MKKRNLIIFVILLLLTNVTSIFATSRLLLGSSTGEVIKIQALEEYVREHYLREVDEESFFTGQLKGTVESLDDPYSQYLTEEEYNAMMESTSGKFYGIGVMVSPGEDNLITVVSPIKDGPAYRAGIVSGDKILKINGKEYLGKDLEEAVKVMKGEENTPVTVTVLSEENGRSDVRDIEITREEITMDSVIFEKIGDIAYIGITQFIETTGDEFNEALHTLTGQGSKGIILDLRGNPGGIVDTSVQVADSLLGEGTIVYAENRKGEVVFNYESDAEHSDIPLVVLINSGSASASELVAGALQDYERGLIIGETSFGKGIVQSLTKFPTGGGIKLTTSEYFTPNGKSIHDVGIIPDEEVILTEGVDEIGMSNIDSDNQLQRAIEIIEEETN